jgi:two-component sensor histidine kinase
MQQQNFSSLEVWSSTMTNHTHQTTPTQYVAANGVSLITAYSETRVAMRKEQQTIKFRGQLPPFDVRLLLREFSHRINNEFASAIGVISIAAARSANDEAKLALTAVRDRLQNYALVHHALQMPEHTSCIDAAAYFRQLCRAISRSKLESKGIELRFAERSFRMNSDRCWRLGLIVSELITNAERHAFRNGGGWIRVELLPSLSFVECRVTNNGTGEPNSSPGHGLKIVEALTKSLGGTIDQRFGPLGATAVVIFPHH